MTEAQVITDAAVMSDVVSRWRRAGDVVALVPTMGFLHEGHRALMEHAATRATRVVVSIFVNPLQFSAGEDFERYPRNAAADAEFLSTAPVDALFMPELDGVYPLGVENTSLASAGPVGDVFEGANRPGHFDGVLTVVGRLFDIVTPDVAVFGRKDAQQVFLVDAMVTRDARDVEIVPVDTVRDADGLALSSRNSYLTPEQRTSALVVPRALALAAGQSTLQGALDSTADVLRAEPGISVDYLAAVDPATFLRIEAPSHSGDALMIVAINVGGTRLLDNRRLSFPQ